VAAHSLARAASPPSTIPRRHDLRDRQPRRYLVQSHEFIEGVTLRQRLNAGRLLREEAISIALQCASSLEPTRRAGVVYRDIKPENIVLRPDGLVKVVDFGLSRMLDRCADGMLERTQTGSVLRTPRYMSPEQARGEKLDPRSDIFSVGRLVRICL
jgi:eukaryotic-like serine/threonine-protein kinase